MTELHMIKCPRDGQSGDSPYVLSKKRQSDSLYCDSLHNSCLVNGVIRAPGV